MDLCISFPPLGPCHDPIVEYCAALCYVTYISLLFMYIFFREKNVFLVPLFQFGVKFTRSVLLLIPLKLLLKCDL